MSYRLIFAEYQKSLQGTKEATSKEDAAYNLTTGTFSDVFSLYYGRKYFGEEAKQEVTQMVKDIKEVYRERILKTNGYQKKPSRKQSRKLDTMKLYIGYPEKVREVTKALKVDDKKILL